MQLAGSEGVTRVAFRAHTHGAVADDRAQGVVTTCTRTRVTAFLANARQGQRTVTAHNTVRATLRVWVTSVAWEAGAECCGGHGGASSILPTGVGLAGDRDRRGRCDRGWVAQGEGVTAVAIRAGADGVVVEHLAGSIHAAGTVTRVNTALVEACSSAHAVGVDHTLRRAP